MTVDVRSLPGGLPANFDFDSQSGILFVLRAIRAAEITAEEKNALKDLVFHYNTGGKDEAVKNKLETALQNAGVTPESVLLEKPKVTAGQESAVISAGMAGFAVGRPVPAFAVVQQSTSPIITQVKVTPTPTPAQPVAEPKLDVPVVEIIKPVLPVAPVSVEVEKFTPVSPLTPASPITPVTPDSPVVPVPPANPIPSVEFKTPVRAVVEEVLPANDIVLSPKTPDLAVTADEPIIVDDNKPLDVVTQDRIERIRVIKSDVNARVGNPVNLVDADNTLGREYMSALLEAMKLLSSAPEAESQKAMDRLEAVYTQVIALLRAKETAVETVTTPIVTPLNPVVELAVPVEPEIVVPMAEIIVPVEPAVVTPVTAPVVIPVPVTSVVQAPPEVPMVDVPVIRSKVSDKPASTPVVNTWGDTHPSAGVDIVRSVAQTVAPIDTTTVARLSTPPAEPIRQAVDSVHPVYQPEMTVPVSDVTPLRAITELPTADEVSAVEAMGSNPLYTKDIDAGLEQLLGEWSIFKKSGLFGTGPKGREHPLYVKIAPLQVPLILSGRFEGSTQEIKQSITDYMNGWRYEQGIIYEANETLDQYLRRVIRHIIDLQKTKRRS
jgi:hypothetical protein